MNVRLWVVVAAAKFSARRLGRDHQFIRHRRAPRWLQDAEQQLVDNPNWHIRTAAARCVVLPPTVRATRRTLSTSNRRSGRMLRSEESSMRASENASACESPCSCLRCALVLTASWMRLNRASSFRATQSEIQASLDEHNDTGSAGAPSTTVVVGERHRYDRHVKARLRLRDALTGSDASIVLSDTQCLCKRGRRQQLVHRLVRIRQRGAALMLGSVFRMVHFVSSLLQQPWPIRWRDVRGAVRGLAIAEACHRDAVLSEEASAYAAIDTLNSERRVSVEKVSDTEASNAGATNTTDVAERSVKWFLEAMPKITVNDTAAPAANDDSQELQSFINKLELMSLSESDGSTFRFFRYVSQYDPDAPPAECSRLGFSKRAQTPDHAAPPQTRDPLDASSASSAAAPREPSLRGTPAQNTPLVNDSANSGHSPASQQEASSVAATPRADPSRPLGITGPPIAPEVTNAD